MTTRTLRLTSAAKSPKSATVRVGAKTRTITQAKTKATVVVTEKPKAAPASTHGIVGSYGGPSPTTRGHGRKLMPVNLGLGAKAITTRDEAFIRDMRKQYGLKAWHRYDADAGCVRRAVSHGFLRHVSGDLASRDAVFQITDKGMAYGASKVK